MSRLNKIDSLTKQVNELIDLISIFEKNEKETHYQQLFKEETNRLQSALDASNVTNSYSVAIVGTFKAGKSSFVNALCDAKLASVNTTPETAAITSFHFDTVAHANIYMTRKEEWESMKEPYVGKPDYRDDSRYGELYRLEQKNDLKKENLSIKELEKRYITPEGKVIQIDCKNWSDTKSQSEFYKEIKPYVSRNDPRHYLVDHLEVYAPSSFLKNIVLIDTPGLNDADQYRVQLTKQKVKEVDVVLYLTTSGNSYSQQDKDFIITELRRGKIKHLMVVVTKVDITFDQSKKDAFENDEVISTLDEHKEMQKQRVKDKIAETLDELLESQNITDQLKELYIDQLGVIEPVVVSSEFYKEKRYDDSGIPDLKEKLQIMFSESERVKNAESNLEKALERSLDSLSSALEKRKEVLSTNTDTSKATKQTEQLRNEIRKSFGDSQRSIASIVKGFDDFEDRNRSLINYQMKDVIDQAIRILQEELQQTDLGKHWKTRRFGNWGHIGDIQERMANACFMKLETALQANIDRFMEYLENLKSEVNLLIDMIKKAEAQYITEVNIPLNLNKSIEREFEMINSNIHAEVYLREDSIIGKLDDFISEEVKYRLDIARSQVTDIMGKGTSYFQNQAIGGYYENIKRLLIMELQNYLAIEIHDFIEVLKTQLQQLYPKLEEHMELELDRHINQLNATLIQRDEKERLGIIAQTSEQLHDLSLQYPKEN